MAGRSSGRWGRWLGLSLVTGGAIGAIVRRVRRLDLRGRVVLVTGGSRGLGLLLAEEFGRRGAHVAICGRDAAALERAERRLERSGFEVLAHACDLADKGAAEAFVDRVAERFGHIDVVVNNAGTMQVAPFESLPDDAFDRSLATNFWSAVHVTRRALPWLRRAGAAARLVNVVSIGGRVAVPHMLPYDAAKFALMGFSEGLRAELAWPRARRIPVTTVVPGPMRTGSFYNAEFAGKQKDEFAWFGASASLPILSTGARRAARRIVRATENGATLVHIGLSAHALALLHGVAPRLTMMLMSATAALLPGQGPGGDTWRGREVNSRLPGSWLLRLGDRAALANNEAPPARVR